jgi:colanic acid biosynthesis glycosyl transferase WcaI
MAHRKNDPIFEITQPSKIWEYMISGRPVIYGGSGEPAEAVRKSGGGIVISPENSDELVEAIISLKNNPDKAIKLGEQGKNYVLENVRRDKFCNDLETYLSKYSLK